ncbi:MAG TPA: Hsp20/alpha crystallin family protein [Candidatus Polarisedimenticolia bacterium]|nr:Hsp20/alpha crystallin family protein [Candidatus Polarisedimenticolia bacterium]
MSQKNKVQRRESERGWLEPWTRLSSEMDRMFDEVWGPRGFGQIFGGRRGRRTGPWAPEVDVLERDGSFIVRADLPGIDKNDLRVEVTDDVLVIQGERRMEDEQEGEGFYRAERFHGAFSRSVPLPEGVDPSQVKASFHDGVLEITMPAPRRQARSRRVEIEAGAKSEAAAGKETRMEPEPEPAMKK